MQCPYCGSWQTRIIDSRMVGDRRRRRYECYDCKQRFTTYEYHEEVALTIEKIVEENKQIREVMKQISLLAKGGMNEQGSIDRQSNSTAKDSTGRRIKDRKV